MKAKQQKYQRRSGPKRLICKRWGSPDYLGVPSTSLAVTPHPLAGGLSRIRKGTRGEKGKGDEKKEEEQPARQQGSQSSKSASQHAHKSEEGGTVSHSASQASQQVSK